MKLKLVSLLILLATLPAPAADQAPRNGTWWATLPVFAQVCYAVGWMDGNYPCETAEQRAANTRMSAGQLAAGLNQFYAGDYRNMGILVTRAAEFVADYRQGWMSPDVMDARIEALRKEANAAH